MHHPYYFCFPATIPFVFSAGFIRLVSPCVLQMYRCSDASQRIVVLKDQKNKAAHADSAQLACEAAGAIRTVSSLTREADCLRLYSSSLDGPLRMSNKTSLWSNMIYGFSQASGSWAIALVFWYGSTLVSRLEISTAAFFTALMVRSLSNMG